jgi:DNA-binding transcriptional LysR family regulator
MPPGYEAILSLGGDFALWNSLLLNWLVWLHRDRPLVALRSSVDTADRLLDRVQTGVLDVAVMYAPHHRPGVEITHILDEELIAVSTDPHRSTLSGSGYVYVDWGPDFVANHDVAFPDLKESGMFVGLGPLALRYMLEVGGTGYFRTRAVQRFIDERRLFRMDGLPTFSYSVYAAFSAKADADLMKWAREGLHVVAGQSYQGWI